MGCWKLKIGVADLWSHAMSLAPEAGNAFARFTSTTGARWPPIAGPCFAQLLRGSSNTPPCAQPPPSSLSGSTVAAQVRSRRAPASTLKKAYSKALS
jgi:hypothetical protein